MIVKNPKQFGSHQPSRTSTIDFLTLIGTNISGNLICLFMRSDISSKVSVYLCLILPRHKLYSVSLKLLTCA